MSLSVIYTVLYCFAVGVLTIDFTYLFDVGLKGVPALELLFIGIGLGVYFVKNILIVNYAENNKKEPYIKAKVIKTIILKDTLSLVIPIAKHLHIFIEELSFDELNGYIYLFLVVINLIWISWGSWLAWYIFVKKQRDVSCVKLYDELVHRNNKFIFSTIIYIVHYVLFVSGMVSLFLHGLFHNSRPIAINAIAFSCLNLLISVVFALSRLALKKHYFIMAVIDVSILAFLFVILQLHSDKELTNALVLIAMISVLNALISILINTKTGDGSLC